MFGAHLQIGVFVEDTRGGGAQLAVPGIDVAGGAGVRGRTAHERMRIAADAEWIVSGRRWCSHNKSQFPATELHNGGTLWDYHH